MAPSKLRRALGMAKDQATIALARAGGAAAGDAVAADVEVAIVHATSHGDSLPSSSSSDADEILALTRYSRARVAACVASLSRRLRRTRTWPVAVKSLALLHRLLTDGDPAFHHEVLLLATARHGRRRGMLDMSRFRHQRRDWDFAAFVHAYAVYLHDRLKQRHTTNWTVVDGEVIHEPWETVPPTTEKKKSTEELVAKAQELKHMLDRFIEGRPTGKARTNEVVTTALYRLVKESVAMYCELTEVMAVLMGRFAELDTPACVRVHSIFTSLAKATAVCRPCDVPEVQRVRQKNLDLMHEFIRDRQASASPWSLSPPATTPMSSPPSTSGVKRCDDDKAIIEPALKERQVGEREERNADETSTAERDGSLVVADDKMADFFNLDEEVSASPPSGEEHGRNLTLALFDGSSEDAPPQWVAFGDPSADWEMALVQPLPAAGANTAAGAARVDPFAASLAVPPPTYVQMTDLQARQRLLVQEQNAWQLYESQRAPWSYDLL
nr:unnamed protein product [Digitaria exilis]